MAIARITLEGFKSLTNHTFEFSPITNKIEAKNGVGKSSLADAIAFGYCGTDRYGNAKPIHLINKDSDGCKVTIESDKGSQIVRTLSKKGNGTIKIIRDNVPNTLTQTQLSGLIGSQDVFMSATMLGYFMALTPSKRKEVLNEVLPKIDPYEIVKERTGEDIKGRYDLSKKSAADLIANDRREISRRINQIEGSLETLGEQRLPEKPEINPAAYEIKDNYESLAEKWSLYNRNVESYQRTMDEINRAKARKHELDQNVQDWQKELEGLTLFPEPQVIDKTQEINDLLSSKKPKPSRPSLMKEVNSERCPTCGTPVTKKMKETVKATNDSLLAEFNKVEQEVEAFNKEIDVKVAELRNQYNMETRELIDIKNKNEKIKTRKLQLESKLANIQYPKISDEPEEPVAPTESLNEQNYKAALKAIKDFEAAKAVYENELKKMSEADTKADSLRTELSSLQASVDGIQKIETVVKNLPNIILDINKKQLEIPDLDVVFLEGDLRIRWNGVPYTALSTGQKMRVDFLLCQKINGFMQRPINLYFVDDSDLIDQTLVPESPAQMFHTVVAPGQEEIQVTHV